MTYFRPSVRLRRVAASAGGFAIALVLALSGMVGPGAEMTEAAWIDTETSQASITAEWSNGGWARTVTNTYTNHASYAGWSNVDRTLIRANERNSVGNIGAATDTRGNVSSSPLSSNFKVDTPYPRPGTNATFCVQAAAPLAAAGAQSGCTNSGPSYTLESQTRAKVWGRSGGTADPVSGVTQPLVWVEANNVATMAECAADGTSFALQPSASLANWGQGNNIGVISTLSSTISGNLSNGYTDSWYRTLSPRANKTVTAWILPRYAPGATQENGLAYIRVSLTSRAFRTAGYALSDMYVTIDQFRTTNKEYLGSFSVIFGRAECAVTTPSRPRLPLASTFPSLQQPNPTYPANPGLVPVAEVGAPLPRPDGTLSYPSDSDYPGAATSDFASDDTGASALARVLEDGEAATPDHPSTTLENTTESDTTASATPSSGEDESPTAGITTAPTTSKTPRTSGAPTITAPTVPDAPTSTTTAPTTRVPTPTSTSAVPTTAIPDEPPRLSATARLEDVGTATVGDDDLAVVTPGDPVPTDAPDGVAALEIWLNGGDPGTTWATFTSDDPERDGWRWAAISQRTGTVVYIR